MNLIKAENNERLRTLVKGANLTQPKALALFNSGLGSAAYSASSWKAFFVRPDSMRFRHVKKELLAHAEVVFRGLQNDGSPVVDRGPK